MYFHVEFEWQGPNHPPIILIAIQLILIEKSIVRHSCLLLVTGWHFTHLPRHYMVCIILLYVDQLVWTHVIHVSGAHVPHLLAIIFHYIK